MVTELEIQIVSFAVTAFSFSKYHDGSIVVYEYEKVITPSNWLNSLPNGGIYNFDDQEEDEEERQLAIVATTEDHAAYRSERQRSFNKVPHEFEHDEQHEPKRKGLKAGALGQMPQPEQSHTINISLLFPCSCAKFTQLARK